MRICVYLNSVERTKIRNILKKIGLQRIWDKSQGRWWGWLKAYNRVGQKYIPYAEPGLFDTDRIRDQIRCSKAIRALRWKTIPMTMWKLRCLRNFRIKVEIKRREGQHVIEIWTCGQRPLRTIIFVRHGVELPVWDANYREWDWEKTKKIWGIDAISEHMAVFCRVFRWVPGINWKVTGECDFAWTEEWSILGHKAQVVF